MSRSSLDVPVMAYNMTPDVMLMNGKGPYGHPMAKGYESFTVTKGIADDFDTFRVKLRIDYR